MWFDGSVQDAVSKSLKESKLFVVLIYGDDEISTKTKSSLESVASEVNQHSVAICLSHNSENARHFAAIYPYTSVPSVFIIKSGAAKVVETGDVDGQSFVSRLLSLVNVSQEPAVSVSTVTTSSTVQPPSQSHPQAQTSASSSSSTSPPTMTLEDKIRLAKQKLAETNKMKEKLAEEQEKQKEKERRDTGRELMKAVRSREEKEIQEAIAERKRDAQLEKEARARVLAQIAQDNEERKRKFGAITPSPNKATTGASPSKQFNFNSDDTRIQFKFPDGHTVAQVFSSSEKLEAALRFIQEQEASFRSFSLSTAYPRRVFTESDFSSSFSDLGLVPSSVLLIIPKSGHSNSQYPSVSDAVTSFSISSLFTSLILTPIWNIWTFISSLIWGSNTTPITPEENISPVSTTTPNRNRKTSPGSRRRSGSGGSTVIHRLKRDSSNDDDNNTWNGNSTQQM